LGEGDAISDSLNHASIIDGCVCVKHRVIVMKIATWRFRATIDKKPMKQEVVLIIVTDGVFSMDGLVAPLDKICDLADKYDAMVMVDECHAAGFIEQLVKVHEAKE
jgi:glycine C-acetyltransferase